MRRNRTPPGARQVTGLEDASGAAREPSLTIDNPRQTLDHWGAIARWIWENNVAFRSEC